MCEWDVRLSNIGTPFLVGEFQPWTGLGPELGADITRATFDTYAQYNWASTSWSYKIITNSGGQGNGTWGMVTNEQGLGLLSKSDTWACAGWDSNVANACVNNRTEITPNLAGENTYYLLIKAGSCCEGNLDVSFDNISLINNTTQEEVIENGNFGSDASWQQWAQNTLPNLNFNDTDSSHFPQESEGSVLHMSGSANINGGIYQAITLNSNTSYTFSGVFKDNGSSNAWAEIYLVSEEPVDGTDVTGAGIFAAIDFNTAAIEEIEALFTAFGTEPYDIHEEMRTAMTEVLPSPLFTLPSPPSGLTLVENANSVDLSWNADTEADLTGYNIYRSATAGSGHTLIAENITDTHYTDSEYNGEQSYYYFVSAVDAEDESYPSNEVSTRIIAISVPGQIEAEYFSAMSGIQTESTTDSGGGLNVGWLDSGDWFEYSIDVASEGDYRIEYRLASDVGSTGFTLSVDETQVDSVAVPNTGGWQAWSTIESTITLPAGEHTLRFDVSGGSWNLNWFRLSQ